MEAYFPLAEQFVTQSEVALCGLASLTMCMNALRVDPMRVWKDAPAPVSNVQAVEPEHSPTRGAYHTMALQLARQ